ncbi:MAG: glycosyl hydrolase [Chitinophagales bacterium]
MISNYFKTLILLLLTTILTAQNVPIGSGSYTTQFPGTDEAGRNGYPSGSPMTTGIAATKPAPTNDWWSAKIKNNHADNLFNYPYTLKTINQGLITAYIPWGVIGDAHPITVGVTGLNANAALVSDFSDWTVTMDWSDANHQFQATAGIGMTFLYFTKGSDDVAQIEVRSGSVNIDNEKLVITDAISGADFAVYAPMGSTWTQSGNNYTSSLNGENYWSMAFLPQSATNVQAVAAEYQKYAYVFPTNTTTTWNYNETTSVVRTDFVVETEVKEGNNNKMLMGLLPHQWANLAADSPNPSGYSYPTVRGEMKTLQGNSFSIENTFYGILPTLPYLDNYSEGFNPQNLNEKVQLLENDGLATWTDSYNEGQVMNRLIQTARIADLMGNTTARDKMVNTVQERLEDWLDANANEVAFLFYYNDTWSALLGYPAGHGQDNNINDHHFHWGYFIHAASFMEQMKPGWASQWGEMIDLLVRDAASDNRDDALFPFLRNFSPYAGHCWANGFASFPQGNDQESTSESMQFNSSLIHWGAITGNDAIRDLGIYLYTTEQTAIEEYWLDIHKRNFAPTQQYSLVSRVWGNSYDNGTFWTADIAASYGIELYPIHGGSLYLGHHTDYVSTLWNEIAANTGILNNEANPNLWHDVYWEYLAFIDPAKAIELYDSYPDRELKFGISDAQTYHWLHAMNVLGNVDVTVTANAPIAAVFNKNGEKTYVAHNYQNEAASVTFSDGYVLQVPAMSMATSKDVALSGMLTSNFDRAYPGGSVELTLAVMGETADKVEFYDGGNLIGEVLAFPYTFKAANLTLGRHSLYAKMYKGESFAVSNLVSVMVGEQVPYLSNVIQIPGSFAAAHYDKYEGGIGQGISYSDVSVGNNGDFRVDEYVDAIEDMAEGNIVGWISGGEWLEYTIEVQEAGLYSLDFRYACGNQSGGGPFQMELDGEKIGPAISVTYTGNWETWRDKNVQNIPFKGGRQVLRLFFENGEMNLGNLTFNYEAPLGYSQPIANAGADQIVVLPETTAILDGSQSTEPEGAALSYTWTQIYGASNLVFSDFNAEQPTISNLEEGVYLIKLRVDNGSYSDEDEVYILSSSGENTAPQVSITSPTNGATYLDGKTVTITATASDLGGSIEKVEFLVDNALIGTSNETPYSVDWTASIGTYSLTAIAYDNEGSSTTSQTVNVTINPAPSCSGTSHNGDFDYEFSPDNNNPTLTFIPSAPNVGNPTCILYYGTNASSLPGYGVTPNVPFRLTASEGTTIHFYYTYSYPGEVERNNAANKDSYVIGTCITVGVEEHDHSLSINYYPNPVRHTLTLELPAVQGESEVVVYDLTGKKVAEFVALTERFEVDMSGFESGVYFFRVRNDEGFRVVR